MITRDYANRYIRPFKNRLIKIGENYKTPDIIKQILITDKNSYLDTAEFARHLPTMNFEQLCRSIFDFLLNNVQYQEDGSEKQLIKSPSALWHFKKGDCKSFSVFTASVLKNLGIPYSYRFASYSDQPVYTHVYVIAHGKERDIIIDVVLKKFNEEKNYTYKKDYKMKGLYRIEGVGEANKPSTMLNLRKPIDEMSETDLELEIARQRLAIEKNIIEEKRGVGSVKSVGYGASLDTLHGIIGAIDNENYDQADEMIGKTKGKAKAFLKKATSKVKKATKAIKPVVKKIVTKTKAGVKKVVKVVAKTITAPARLVIKGVLEVALPKAAPAFLYLFIKDPAILAKLPATVRNKRDKQQKLANFITNGIGVKETHFMAILRNGIMKKYKMSPEAKIAEMFKGKVSGVGAISPEIIQAVIELIGMVSQIVKSFKKPEFSKDDLPDESDVIQTSSNPEQATKNEEAAKAILNQPDAVEPGESIDTAGGRSTSFC